MPIVSIIFWVLGWTGKMIGKSLQFLTISNINNIICNSLIVNGNNIDTTNNNIYFQNNIIGSASDSRALITDINNNIKNIIYNI